MKKLTSDERNSLGLVFVGCVALALTDVWLGSWLVQTHPWIEFPAIITGFLFAAAAFGAMIKLGEDS